MAAERQLLLLLALCACARREPLDEAAAYLRLPPGGTVEAPPAPARRLERVETSVCYPSRRGAEVARELSASLAAAGWAELKVDELTPARWTLRGAREALAVAGVVEEGAPGCPGARARVGVHAAIPGAHRTTAGTVKPQRISP